MSLNGGSRCFSLQPSSGCASSFFFWFTYQSIAEGGGVISRYTRPICTKKTRQINMTPQLHEAIAIPTTPSMTRLPGNGKLCHQIFYFGISSSPFLFCSIIISLLLSSFLETLIRSSFHRIMIRICDSNISNVEHPFCINHKYSLYINYTS
jgi:hypothetical protein